MSSASRRHQDVEKLRDLIAEIRQLDANGTQLEELGISDLTWLALMYDRLRRHCEKMGEEVEKAIDSATAKRAQEVQQAQIEAAGGYRPWLRQQMGLDS